MGTTTLSGDENRVSLLSSVSSGSRRVCLSSGPCPIGRKTRVSVLLSTREFDSSLSREGERGVG